MRGPLRSGLDERARVFLRPMYLRGERLARRYFPSQLDNFEWNRKMATGYARRHGGEGQSPLGEEWGASPEEVEEILVRFLYPYLGPTDIVAEIGVGGGRIAERVAPRVERLHVFDISPRMLDAARLRLAGFGNVEFTLQTESALPPKLSGSLDVVYSFATFLHLDLHTMWRYFQEMARVLRPEGHAFVHTATITTPRGWQRFVSQEEFSVFGFYFVSPEIVQTLASRAGLRAVDASESQEDNAYLSRDYFAVFRR
jgi:SAM-dependent methyltransferase